MVARQLTLALCLVACLAACGGGPPVDPSPATAPRRTGSLEGMVNHESYVQGRLPIPAGPLAGAQVTVTEGPGAGTTLTTGNDGAYHFDLPEGPFRLRLSGGSVWESRDSEPGNVQAGMTTRVATVTLRLQTNVPVAPWTITGRVLDGTGNGVPDVSVSANGAFLVTGPTVLGFAMTDLSGRFVITSTRAHDDPISVSAVKIGYWRESGSTVVIPCSACSPDVTLRLFRILREWLDAPSSMQVGSVAPVTGVTELDDGRTVRGRIFVQTSDPGIVQVLDLVAPYERVYVKAVGAGTATLSGGSVSGRVTTSIRVYP
jgi:hypothetical protein